MALLHERQYDNTTPGSQNCDCELAITRTEDTEHRDDFLLFTGHHNVRMIAQTNVSNSTG